MNIKFRSSFVRDLKKIRDRSLLRRVHKSIEEVEEADTIIEIGQVQKLKGSDSYYRIRIGEYRIGLSVKRDTITFVRFLHRRDIYRYFP